MIDLPYSLIIETTDEPDFFSYFSPDLPGFSGVAHSVEGCIYQARLGMLEHIDLLRGVNGPSSIEVSSACRVLLSLPLILAEPGNDSHKDTKHTQKNGSSKASG
ncbi:hypothetical protein [uncultured Lamprocystis sp.]|jgi:hypothetical protein|uniref:hypothetical protein n=1 Tax=uncultured Lamprocystis sp. TaxID=543132 RepID=UPI0025CCD4E3|nr:hypothetical protein [uncultured Lamprocystis sp.]